MLPVVWLESALQDISRITAYIADSNPNAAYKLNAKLRDDAEFLVKQLFIFVTAA